MCARPARRAARDASGRGSKKRVVTIRDAVALGSGNGEVRACGARAVSGACRA